MEPKLADQLDKLCSKAKATLDEEPVDNALMEGIAKDFCLIIVDSEDHLSPIKISEAKEAFYKASKIGKRTLDAQIKQIKESRKESERLDLLEGQTEEFKKCFEHIQSLSTCTRKEARIKEGEIYREIFDNAFESDEIDFFLDEIANVTKAKISSIKRKWALLSINFRKEDKEAMIAQVSEETGIDISPFVLVDKQFHRTKTTEEGTSFVRMCNFNAYIAEDIRYIDGHDDKNSYKIKGELIIKGKEYPLETIEVESSEFKGMNWLHQWGTGPNIDSTAANDANIRDCIEKASLGRTKKHKAFTHTGWRKIDDNYYFLQNSGGIDENGLSDNIEVRLDSRNKASEGKLVLNNYDLTVDRDGNQLKVDDKDSIKHAISSSLDILQMSDNKAACYLLLLSAYRAVLNEFLNVDFSTFFYGYTGSFKTEFTALSQAHFGAGFHGRCLPANWTGTGMSLEYLLFITKDVLTACDDFNPVGTSQQIAEYYRKAEIVFRGQGNQAGRTRLTSNIELRPELHPRGLVIGSGEDLPQGESLRSRILFAELKKGDITSSNLTRAQDLAANGSYSLAMYNFVKYIAKLAKGGDLSDKLTANFRIERENLRKMVSDASHLRLVDQVASLSIALDILLDFSLSHGAISESRAERISEQGRITFTTFLPLQDSLQLDENPAAIFCKIISEALVGGKAHLECEESEINSYKDPEKYGYFKEKDGYGGFNYRARGETIGWIRQGEVYLSRDLSFSFAQRIARDQGGNIPVTKNAMFRIMKQKHVLKSFDPEKTTKRISVKGVYIPTLHVKHEALSLSSN